MKRRPTVKQKHLRDDLNAAVTLWMEQALSAQRDLSLMTAARNEAREQIKVWIRHRDAMQIERDTARGDLALAKIEADLFLMQRTHWKQVALHAQRELNRVPGWILYCVGAVLDARRILADAFSTFRRA